jgi:hypothetical protein
MKKIFFTLFFISIINAFHLVAQNFGTTAFNFLNHSTSARMTALGSNMIATKDNDLAAAWFNPAAISPDMHRQVVCSYDFMQSGVGASYLGYAHHSDKANLTFHSGLQFVNYGSFKAATEDGSVAGTFNAQDVALAIGAAKVLSPQWAIGLNTKFIFSNLETYSATGLSADIATTYNNEEKRTTFTFLAKNIGTQLSTYTGAPRGALPFELQMGFSKKLKHLPLRFSFIAKDLQRWRITYDDPNVKEETFNFGEPVKETPAIVKNLDNLARHLLVNGEFLLGKKERFKIRFGYNHLTKKELNVPPLRTLSGFSFGFGFKVKKLNIDFGRNNLHHAGGFNHLTLSTAIGKKN